MQTHAAAFPVPSRQDPALEDVFLLILTGAYYTTTTDIVLSRSHTFPASSIAFHRVFTYVIHSLMRLGPLNDQSHTCRSLACTLSAVRNPERKGTAQGLRVKFSEITADTVADALGVALAFTPPCNRNDASATCRAALLAGWQYIVLSSFRRTRLPLIGHTAVLSCCVHHASRCLPHTYTSLTPPSSLTCRCACTNLMAFIVLATGNSRPLLDI